jgi:hypothetical protein
MFKLSYYVFDFENKYCCLFLINKEPYFMISPRIKTDNEAMAAILKIKI